METAGFHRERLEGSTLYQRREIAARQATLHARAHAWAYLEYDQSQFAPLPVRIVEAHHVVR